MNMKVSLPPLSDSQYAHPVDWSIQMKADP